MLDFVLSSRKWVSNQCNGESQNFRSKRGVLTEDLRNSLQSDEDDEFRSSALMKNKWSWWELVKKSLGMINCSCCFIG